MFFFAAVLGGVVGFFVAKQSGKPDTRTPEQKERDRIERIEREREIRMRKGK